MVEMNCEALWSCMWAVELCSEWGLWRWMFGGGELWGCVMEVGCEVVACG